jgi:phosphatidylserine/phosphatidylglycerophosphate/cardiolipin synthase-like enzyme
MGSPSSSELLLPGLEPAALEDLASALSSERLRAPFTTAALRRLVAADQVDAVRHDLVALAERGFTGAQTATLLQHLATERRHQRALADRLELVWSGPAVAGQRLRDTAVVVRSLCRAATRSVLVANFSFDRPGKDRVAHARALWQPLADAMAEHPELAVRMIVNVARDDQRRPDWTPKQWCADFLERFVHHLWPADARLPALYYDPRALHSEPPRRAIMHAKCVIVDLEAVFLSSANFTHAGHERNIEAGVVVPDASLARRLTDQFDILIAQDALKLLPIAL